MIWSNRRAYLDVAAGMSANTSSPHEEGRIMKRMLEEARTAIARLVEVQADDVIFTSGATESNALAILGATRALQKTAGGPLHLFYLPSAHASLTENARSLAASDVSVEPLPIRGGRVDTETLARSIRPHTCLVSMEAVCGETGIVWNTREVANVLRAARGQSGRILLHVDASQAPLTEKISRAHFDADMLSLDSSKVSAVRGIGVLIAHRTIALEPLYLGGGQERQVRSGSQCASLAKEFAAGLAQAARDRAAFRKAAERDRETLLRRVSAIPESFVQEGPAQAPHILNLALPGRDTDYLVALLDEAGFAVSTRSACETDSEEGSRAVFALTGDTAKAKSTLRISWGPDTRSRDLLRFSEALVRAVGFVDSTAGG